MKVIINNRDYVTWPKAMAETLTKQGHEVIFVDNASTYPPLLTWYASSCPYRVIRLNVNIGGSAPWVLVDELGLDKDFYVVTDPDLDISAVPTDWPEVLRDGIDTYDDKCGLSLLDDRVPSTNPAYFDDGLNEYGPFENPTAWGEELYFSMDERQRCRYIGHHVATTFAMYAPGTRFGYYGVRADRPYSARHLPWHLVLDVDPNDDAYQILMDDEAFYYFEHAQAHGPGLGSFSKPRFTKRGILDTYKKRRDG